VEGSTNSAWLFIAVIAGAVGSAMFIYGIRQKRPVPLVFGVLIGGYCYLVHTAWIALLIGIVLIAAFIVVQKRA
jgi:hypothetical protein